MVRDGAEDGLEQAAERQASGGYGVTLCHQPRWTRTCAAAAAGRHTAPLPANIAPAAACFFAGASAQIGSRCARICASPRRCATFSNNAGALRSYFPAVRVARW